MIKDKTFDLGKFRYRLLITKNNDESSKLNDESKTEIINYFNAHLDIIDQKSNTEFQEAINSLEPGIYEVIIPLNSESFNRIEQVDGEVIHD